MSRLFLMLSALLSVSVSTFAQDTLWSRTYGTDSGDACWSVQQTTDLGYIMAGEHWYSGDDADIYLVKIDSRGDTLWTRVYGGNSVEEGYSVQQTMDKGFIMTGYTSSFGTGDWDVYLIKTDSIGAVLWDRTYGGIDRDVGHFVQQTSDEGYIIGGRTFSFGAGYQDFYLIKTDSLGDVQWTRMYGSSNNEEIYSVQQTTDGGYIVVGFTAPLGGEGDVYLIKTDENGDTMWVRGYGGSGSEGAESVRQTMDGGYTVTGGTNSFGAGGHDMYLIKTDSLGNMLWTRTYGSNSFDYGFCVQQTSDEGYVVAGVTYSFGVDSSDVYMIKTDSLGEILWSRTCGGNNHDYGLFVEQTFDGAYIVGGFTSSFGTGDSDFMLTKLNHRGNTCIGEFVTSTVMSVSCSVTSPFTVVTSPPTIVTNPSTEVASPAVTVTTICEVICADVNGDGKVDISDAVYLVLYLFRNGDPPDCPESYTICADANGDGEVTISDVVYLINYLLKGGDPPIC